jgi:tetratricopeptide (TPR) repeat protein
MQEYQHALDLQSNNSLAHFRMGEALFYQKNNQAAANAFRAALDGDLDPSYKWVEVWSHIYIGKIYDLTGQRERAVNEYSRAQHLKDDTGGAQAEAERLLKKPYGEPAAETAAKS